MGPPESVRLTSIHIPDIHHLLSRAIAWLWLYAREHYITKRLRYAVKILTESVLKVFTHACFDKICAYA